MSARSSRISHPLGARFFLIHEWVARDLGLAAAAVLGALDFLDRAQPQAGQILASRARLVADLQAIVGRDAVDAALARLISMDWVERHVLMSVGTRNLQTSYSFSLRADVVSIYAQRHSRCPDFRTPENRNSGKPASASQAGNQDATKQEEVESAAACPRNREKNFELRPSGIVTWYPHEAQKAERIEESFDQADITLAVASVNGRGQDAVPGLVHRELKQFERAKQKEAKRVAQASLLASRPDRLDAEMATARLATMKAMLASRRPVGHNSS